MSGNIRTWPMLALIVAIAPWSSQTCAQGELTADGLQQAAGRFDAQYWKPGATFDQYRRIAFLDVFVDFRDDWLREQNRGKRSFNEVTTADMENIQTRLAEDFVAEFSDELQQDDGYRIAQAVSAADLLVLRPAILDLDVAADTYGSQALFTGASDTVMTLYLELYDSSTSTLIGRIVDVEAEPDPGRPAVRRILSRWARQLRTTLEER